MTKTIYSKNKKFQGIEEKSVQKYLGIPYAKAPMGELRFKAPQKITDNNKTIRSVSYPANPIQKGLDDTSEDCLYLNIWRPSKSEGKLPVMAWIYGGSFETGGIGEKGAGFGLTFDGQALAEDTNCIIVTINYRINVFGFLDFSNLSDKFEQNIGLKDIVCALEWIQENIAEFDGDASNVTVFGQSAGGALVAALSKIPSAKNLFHKMIVQSACLESFYTEKEARDVAKKYLELLNIAENQVEDLLKIKPDKLIEVIPELEAYVRDKVLGITTFCPIIDGEFLTDFPFNGAYESDKPLIIGSTKNEGRMFTKFSKEIAAETGAKFLPYVSESERQHIFSNYPGFPSFEKNAEVITDLMYTVPKHWVVDNYLNNNQVYMYRFDFYSGFFRFSSLRACHASDVPMLFGVGSKFYIEGYFATKKLGKQIRQYLGNFAHSGNPNGQNLPKWHEYNQITQSVLLLDKKITEKANLDGKTKEIYKDYSGFFHEVN